MSKSLRLPLRAMRACRCVAAGRFTLGMGRRVLFRGDAQGKVNGLNAIDDRVRDLRFVRHNGASGVWRS